MNVEEKVCSINTLLKDIRTDRNISQSEISKKTGLSKQMVSKMEHKNGNPTLSTLVKYCDCIGVDLEELLRKYKESRG